MIIPIGTEIRNNDGVLIAYVVRTIYIERGEIILHTDFQYPDGTNPDPNQNIQQDILNFILKSK